MKNNGRKYLLLLLLFTAKPFLSQDIHFSQFYESPVLLNPAAAGASASYLRLAANYRNQWSNVISPFKTMGLAFDSKIQHLKKTQYNHFGYGVTMYTDKTGSSQLSTNQFNLDIAYHVFINRKNILSMGVKAGMFQRVINTTGHKWDSQFNGKTYDGSLPTLENSTYRSLLKFDLGAGLLYRHQDSPGNVLYEFGASVSHLTKPNISFYSNDPSLKYKYMFHGLTRLKLNHHIYIIPAAMYAMQGKQTDVVFGANVRLTSKDFAKEKTILSTHKATSTALQLGVFHRYKDALIFVASTEYNKRITLGISYDVNISGFKTASKFRGGFEVCLTAIQQKHSKLRTKH